MTKQNPFAINFGKLPVEYISRDIIVEEILQELYDENMQIQCFMLSGLRGSGKTVTLTAIERQIEKDKDWIVVRLNPDRDMLGSLVAKLYDRGDFVREFIDKSLNLSKFGIGVDIRSKPPVADIESALETILEEIKRKHRHLLVTIDEVSNSPFMREFASGLQILIRKDMPIYLIMTGLYENIMDLENVDNLTFLYRAPRYDMEPLNITLISSRYRQVFGIGQEAAMEMALLTRGYPFAYQALGKYVWEEEKHILTDTVLAKYDDALSHYVYKKIWSELSEKDRWYMSFIVKKETMPVSELLELTGQKKNEFSQYRARLSDKGLIDTSVRGSVRYVLPRFDVFIQNQLM